MRVGQNPAKSIDGVLYRQQIPQPARVTVAIIIYIPFLSGYYAESLDVLKVCLGSLWKNTPSDAYDLLIFDNASCVEVRSYLSKAHQSGQIQYLVLSDKNVGKGGGWNFIFQGAPGEIIAYADSDVYFYPGWLEQSLQLIDIFPKVGMVSSRPLRTPQKYYTSTLDWARSQPDVRLEQGQFISWEVFKEHNDSLGVSVEQAGEWFKESIDWRIEYHGQVAYVGAAHFQFVAPKAVLQTLTPFKMDRPMGQVRSLDQKLNDQGYLRLNTVEPLVKHLGNSLEATRIDDTEGSTALGRPLPASTDSTSRRKSIVTKSHSRRLANLPPVRRSLLWLYDQIFRLYYGSKN